jgi:hypothetical protein
MDFNNEYYMKICDTIKGNDADIELKDSDCEVRADITVAKKHCVRVWGQIKDCDDKPVKDALVKLLQVCFDHGKIQYKGIAHTISDCNGFYQFDICVNDEHIKYKIIAGKATEGNDRVIERNICNPCDECDD